MTALRIVWTGSSRRQYDELQQRAANTNRLEEFANNHSQIVAILRDLDRAIEKSDPLYRTKKPGGVVRHFLHRFISVTFCVFAAEQLGWVIRYLPIPANWPDEEAANGQDGKH